MKIAYFDCIAGASGDMLLGALVDAGAPLETLRERLAVLKLDEFDLQARRVDKNGFGATKVEVLVHDEAHARHLPQIEAIVTDSGLPAAIKEQAVAIFRRMGAVEAGIHGTTLEHVHLHELGGVDTIVDVVGVLTALDILGIERVYASPLPMGRGFVQGAHGQIPLPAPATLGLLKGVPLESRDIQAELVTPTGAALLTALAESFGPIPTMTLRQVGYGAGGRDLTIPNILRVLVGDQPVVQQAAVETLTLLETNIDDLNPEIYDYVLERLFAAGALDVFLTPIQMKKNRPATLLQVLARPADVEAMTAILFAETSTLGIRQQTVERHCLARTVEMVETPYGPVRVKVASWGNDRRKAAPEYEDCRRLAETNQVPLRQVYRAAEQAAARLLTSK